MTETKEKTEAPAPPQSPAATGFPRAVFRPGHTVRIGKDIDVDTLTVGGQAALRSALDHGWFLDPTDMTEAGNKKGVKDLESEAKKGRRRLKEGEEGYNPETDPNNIAYDPYKDPGNPRPGEPDNAPLRNTPYDEPQSGDLPDPPTSPAEPPRQTPIPPEEATVPGEEPKPTPHTGDVAGAPGAKLEGPKSAAHGGGSDEDEKSLRDKGAPPGSHKVK